jgi:hypothetical protein
MQPCFASVWRGKKSFRLGSVVVSNQLFVEQQSASLLLDRLQFHRWHHHREEQQLHRLERRTNAFVSGHINAVIYRMLYLY